MRSNISALDKKFSMRDVREKVKNDMDKKTCTVL